MKAKKKGKVGRPRILTDEERRKRERDYAAAWRRAHPEAWKAISKRAWAKKRAKGEGIEVELII